MIKKLKEIINTTKKFFINLKETFGFWAMIEIGAILFAFIPAFNGDYNIGFASAIVWVALHKFNKNWIK